MAVALIGGVIASTLLTLFVVPCVYSLLSRFERPETMPVAAGAGAGAWAKALPLISRAASRMVFFIVFSFLN